MTRSRARRRWPVLTVALAAVAAVSCSSDDATGTEASGTSAAPATTATAGPATATTTDSVAFTVRSPEEITPPVEDGEGVIRPQPSPPLPEGYVEEELFVAGTATSFTATETPDDGSWTATPSDEAEYRTRVLVRRPPADAFSGTVVVEWFNVSAIESAPDWAFLAEEIARAGHAYVGVSAQAQGVEGGETLLDVQVDPETAEDLDAVADASGLKNIDPQRYGTLVHPGDAYSYDIFSQVGRAAATPAGDLLGGLQPAHVIAVGESQSAAFLTTLVNAVHPLDPVFDGFLVHSRGAGSAPLDGDLAAARRRSDVADAMRRGVHVRTDLDVPVFLFETETDLTLLGYAHARQPDTDLIRTWEVAGTAHADAHLLRSMLGGPRDPSVGSLLGCTEPINTGPQHEVLQAALRRLVEWVADGIEPPAGDRIELVDGDADEVAIARDERGIAIGGVRTPLVDVPVATLTGDPPGGGSIAELREGGGVCFLFGATIAFDRATLVDLYGTADAYVEAFRASADDAVAAGFLLQEDADELVAEAEANRALFE
jgi:hypothetical protein